MAHYVIRGGTPEEAREMARCGVVEIEAPGIEIGAMFMLADQPFGVISELSRAEFLARYERAMGISYVFSELFPNGSRFYQVTTD